jgi:uncharacterized protein (TIGR03086 family)
MSFDEVLPLHRRAVLDSVRVVAAIEPGDLDRPTPCGSWSLADLLRHMSVQHRGFGAAVSGHVTTLDDWHAPVDGRDLVTDYLSASAFVIEAFAAAKGVDRPVTLPEISTQLSFRADQALRFHLVDYVVHAWDVARSIGQTYEPDRNLSAAALDVALRVPNGPERTKPNSAFAPGVDPGTTAPILNRVLSLLGRAPDWTAPR